MAVIKSFMILHQHKSKCFISTKTFCFNKKKVSLKGVENKEIKDHYQKSEKIKL